LNKNFYISFSKIKEITSKLEKSICKISGKIWGNSTGFFCKIPYFDLNSIIYMLVITVKNLNSQNIFLKGEELRISLNNDKKILSIFADDSRKIYKNEKDEVIFIEIRPNDGLDRDSFLEIEDNINQKDTENIYINKSIYLLHYPKGQISEFSLGVIKDFNVNDCIIEYFCTTRDNSYGCPIIKYENNKVIGIHKSCINGNNWNIGIFIKRPIQEFNKVRIIKLSQIDVPDK